MTDKLTRPIQESIITLIATNEDEGKIASGLITSKMFDEAYRDLVDRILAYRKRHGQAPGKSHLDDLVDNIIGDERNKKHKTYIRILEGVLANADTLNPKYVLSRVNDFSRRQALKAALLEAGDLYESAAAKEDLVTSVEAILMRAVKPQRNDMEKGVYLGDPKRALNFLDKTQADYKIGIEAFDRRNLGPTRGTLLMFMAPKGAGKSWFCIHVGKMCLLQNAKVLHITLEMSEDQCIKRYQQSFHGLGQREERYKIQQFVMDSSGQQLVRLRARRRRIKPEKSLENPGIRRFLKQKMKTWGSRMDRLHIKGFAMKSLTIERLDAYIDMLELEGFIPDVCILDYPDEMKIPIKDYRLGVGYVVSEFRGLCQRRFLCGIAPTQTSKAGWDAATIKGSMVAEDASKFRTADMVIIQSKSKMEKQLGLARLWVEKHRDDVDSYEVIITQNIRTGQYVLDSMIKTAKSNYMDLIKPDYDEFEEEETEDGSN